MKASRVIYKNGNRIRIDFPYNPAITIKLKEIPDTRWSKSLKAWHIPYTKEAFAAATVWTHLFTLLIVLPFSIHEKLNQIFLFLFSL